MILREYDDIVNSIYSNYLCMILREYNDIVNSISVNLFIKERPQSPIERTANSIERLLTHKHHPKESTTPNKALTHHPKEPSPQIKN